MFHVTVWKDQAVGAQERMEDTIIVCVSDEGVHGEHSKFCLNEDSENMETLNREVSSLGTEGPNKDIHAEEEMFKEGVVVASEAFEILIRNGVTDDNNKGSRTLQCFDIDDDLDEKYIKELNSTLKIPHFEALGKNEKLYNVKSCLEVQCPEESVTLQGSKLRGLDAFKTEFHLNSEETKKKELLTQMDFSGTLLNSWEQGTHSRLPVIGGGDCLSLDLEEEKDLLSFHITACREQVAGKRVRETHTNDSVSNEEQSEQSAVTLKVVNQNKMSSESEVRVSGEGSSYNRCPCIREIKANETDVREKLIVDGRASESPKQNYDNDKRRNRTIPIKHCCVVLKDLRDELNEKYEDSLISLDTEIQSLKRQNERKASFSDPTQVTLHDVLDENDVKKQSTIINIKALLENEKLDNTEKKEIKSPEEVVTSRGSNNMDIEIHHSAEESQIKGSLVQMNSPDLSDMVEEGIFTRLSLMEEEYKSSSINIFHMEEEDQGERRLQLDSCLVSNMTSEVQKEKQREVVPGTMFMKHWNKPTEQLEREVLPSSSLVKNPNRKGFNSRFSGGLFTSNISQSSTIILAPGNALQTEDLQGIPVEGTSPCLSVNRTESVLGEGKPHNRSPLLPVSEEDIHVTVWEPSCISPPAVEKLETNQKGELISPVKSQVPRVESLVQYSLEESAEEVSQGQLIVEELKSLSKRDFKSSYESDDSSCFLTEGAEDFDNVDVNVTDGQNKAVQPETRGEHLNPSKVTLQMQSMEVPVSCRNMAECHSCMADIKKIKHSDIKKSTALHCPEQNRDGHIGYVEKEMNLEPAKETCHVGKMSGPVVRLLGVSSKACKPRRLKRLVELEDSSDDEACVCCQSTQKMSRPVLGVSSSKTCKPCKMQRVEELKDLSDDVFADVQVTQEIKDSDYHPTRSKKEMRQFLKPYAAHVLWQKPLNSDDSNVKKRKCRKSASKEASPSASVSSLQLSEEQSRTKVMNSLHGMLQKRLEESPDLDVHEDTILRLANNLEKEIFNLFLCVDHRYKNKYRSLLFNLKAPKNKLLFHQVVLGEVSPQCLVQMNSLEMAPKELAEWRAKERKHVLEVIEKQQREAPKRRPTKLTHKGEIEIHQEVDDDCTLEDLYGSALYVDKKPTSPPAAKSKRDTTDQHKSHLLDPDCLICTGRMAPDGERGFNPPQMKSASKKKSDSSTRLPTTTGYSEKGRKNLEKDRPASTGILKKNPRLQKQAKDIVLWEGLIQMFSIKQFAAKAYPVSGYGSHLIQALPELIQSRGCILPEDVWGYLDSIWPGEAKEMSVIQFWPAMTKDFSTYNMLYSYLNNKQRYGIVDSNQMEMFMVPLPAFQPVPAKFHVLGGPGLDSHHSCLLLGLILPKKVSGSSSANSMGLSLLKETKRKRVTFKNNLVSKHSSSPLHSSGSAKLAEPPQQIPSMAFTGEWPSRNEYPPSGSHSQELLTNNNIFALQTAVDEVLNGWTSHETSSHCQNREKGTNQSVQNCAFHSFSNLSCVGGQSHSMAEESLGRQQNVTGGHAEFQADAGPATSQNWNFGPLSSWSLCSHECGGNVALNANMLDIEQLSSILYPGVTSSGVSQVPAVPCLVSHESSAISEVQNHAAIGETNPTLPMEEALSLIQHLEALVQLNAQIQNQILFSLPSLDLPATLQATTPGESQIVRGSTFPLIPQESSVYPNSQSTLPPFSGPVYPPSGC